MINRGMKLKDIVLEGPRHKSFAWRNDLGFTHKLNVVRDFLRASGDRTVASIYQQAANDGRFSPDDIQFLQQKMEEAGVDQRTIRSLKD